jgi:predicted metal-dependent hydrolase
MESIAIKDLAVEVRRSGRRKTVELSVDRDGRILLHAPESADREKLETMVLAKLIWIYQQLGRKEEELHQLPAKEYVSGEGFYYRGRKYRLKIIDDIRSFRNGNHLRLLSGRFIMPRLVALRASNIY